MLSLVFLTIDNHLSAATTVTITNDWASAKVHVVSPKPSTIPTQGNSWTSAYEGKADADLNLEKSGVDPVNDDWFVGTAMARIGPTIGLNHGLTSATGYTQMFGSFLLADDTQGCEAEATLDSVWSFTVAGDPASFHARGFVEAGHGMKFTLRDHTTGLDILSKTIKGFDGFGEFGTLEPDHDYSLTLHQRALFGEGDGFVGFGFGFADPVLTESLQLAIPETSSLSMLALGALLLVRRQRR